MKHQRAKNRVLVVNNDSTVIRSFGDILRSAGFEVLFAENGANAVKILATASINLIILDFRAPFNAKDIVSGRSRTIGALSDVDPFLPLLLTHDPADEAEHATLQTADMVLTHPVEPLALLEAVDILLVETPNARVQRKAVNLAVIR